MTPFIIAYHISQVNVQTNYCNNNLLILDVKQLNNIMKLYYFNTLKALWDGQGKIKMYYGMSRVKKQLSGKRHIVINLSTLDEVAWHWWRNPLNRKFVGTIIVKNFHAECKLIRINIKIILALNGFLVLQFKNFCYLSISNTINCFIEARHSVLSGRSGIKFKLTEKG